MSKSKKKKKNRPQHTKTTVKSRTSNVKASTQMVTKLEKISQNIGVHNKYSERIKTSYICLFMYFFIWSLVMKLVTTDPTTSIGLLATGTIACGFNIVKACLSIHDNEKVKHNVVIIIIHSLCAFIFSGWMFV